MVRKTASSIVAFGKKGRADSIDQHVGVQIRLRRTLLGLSQEKLAEGVGVSFQQIQKYENGANRVSASRLYQFSKILNSSIDFFFEDYAAQDSPATSFGFGENEQAPFENVSNTSEDILKSKETLELIRVYYSIENPKLRKDFLKLGKSMGQTMKNQDG